MIGSGQVYASSIYDMQTSLTSAIAKMMGNQISIHDPLDADQLLEVTAILQK